MNKLHILIPSLAITCTLPALSIVSCGSSSSQWKQSDGEFKWTHETPDLAFENRRQAADEYFNRISKKMLADEIVKSKADWINDPEHLEYYKNWKINVKVNKIDKEHHLCSLVIHESGDTEIWQKNEFAHNDYTLTLTKIPMELEYDSNYDNPWFVYAYGVNHEVEPGEDNKLNLDWVYTLYKTWSFSVKGTIEGHKIEDTVNYGCLDDLDNHQDVLSLLNGVEYCSYFFNNARWK